jgi:hypothetical protein
VDAIVLRAIAKWPNVPAVHGWLSLDRRGRWLIGGERIGNPMVCAFIGRNYGPDEQGRWFFQNGPQRVFVELEYTPFIYRVVNADGAPLALECHTGDPVARINAGWLDEHGALLLETEHGVGVVHDGDLDRLFPHFIEADGEAPDEALLEERIDRLRRQQHTALCLRFCGSNVGINPVLAGKVPQRFGFVPRPLQPAGGKACRP